VVNIWQKENHASHLLKSAKLEKLFPQANQLPQNLKQEQSLQTIKVQAISLLP